jgi:hypothetical protein
MPVRSPLTAALRQRSRQPARHVVYPLANFSDGISAVINMPLQPKIH